MQQQRRHVRTLIYLNSDDGDGFPDVGGCGRRKQRVELVRSNGRDGLMASREGAFWKLVPLQ